MNDEKQAPEKSRITPNTFQTPNILVDEYMRFLDGDEVKCYLVIVRKTLGWLKRTDKISKSQIADLTGLSDDRVNTCMKNLVAFRLVARLDNGDPLNKLGVEWKLELDDTKVDVNALIDRYEQRKTANTARTEKMRVTRGDVAHTRYVAHTQGGDVAHTPQKPLSKAIKRDIDAIAQKLSDCKFTFNPNSGTIIQIWKDDFPDEVIERAIEEAYARAARSITYVDRILANWKMNGIPPTREERAAAAAQQKGKSGYGNNSRPSQKPVINEPTEADMEAARAVLAAR